MATVGHPELLILDEPLNGLDPLSIVEVNSMIKTLSDEGVTILVSSHILSELSRVASDFIFIDAGKIIGQTTLEAIKSRTTDHSELVTNNNEAALELLSARGIRAEQDGGVIRVYNDGNIETDEIAGMLFENKISVTGLTKISENLEDYFLNLINAGGVTR
jgi:ABC-type multidrug transport system ATPase subunit